MHFKRGCNCSSACYTLLYGGSYQVESCVKCKPCLSRKRGDCAKIVERSNRNKTPFIFLERRKTFLIKSPSRGAMQCNYPAHTATHYNSWQRQLSEAVECKYLEFGAKEAHLHMQIPFLFWRKMKLRL